MLPCVGTAAVRDTDVDRDVAPPVSLMTSSGSAIVLRFGPDATPTVPGGCRAAMPGALSVFVGTPGPLAQSAAAAPARPRRCPRVEPHVCAAVLHAGNLYPACALRCIEAVRVQRDPARGRGEERRGGAAVL